MKDEPAGPGPLRPNAQRPTPEYLNTRIPEYPSPTPIHLTFDLGPYDRSRPLVIDPVVSFGTFLGGRRDDRAWDIAVDASGNAHVVGTTASSDFPTASAVDSTLNQTVDLFVAKIDPSVPQLVYSTYLGGSSASGDFDEGRGIALDTAGNAYVAGTATSGFPTTLDAFQRFLSPGSVTDAVLAKLSLTGTLLYSTFFGGEDIDFGRDVAVDSTGAYLVGTTFSRFLFPLTPNAIQNTNDFTPAAFVAKLDPSRAGAAGLLYSTFLGGNHEEDALGVAVRAGSAYVTGRTTSTDFPLSNPLQASPAGGPFFRTLNGGGTWSEEDTGLPNIPVSEVVVDPVNPNILYVGTTHSRPDALLTGGGLLRSTDGGATWSFRFNGPASREVVEVAIDPGNPNRLYAGTSPHQLSNPTRIVSGLFRSLDGGAFWTSLGDNLPVLGQIREIVIDPRRGPGGVPAAVYIALNVAGANPALFKSVNDGASFSPVVTGLPAGAEVQDLVMDPAAPDTLYAALPGSGIFKTVNGGQTWQAANTGITNLDLRSLAISPGSPQTLFAAGFRTNSGGGLFRTTNGGASWQAVGAGLPGGFLQVEVAPSAPGTLYAAVEDDVFKSTDNGDSWQPTGSGLTSEISSLAIHPTNPDIVFAGAVTEDDVFVTKVDPAGGSLVYSTYFGAPDWDQGNAIAVDAAGQAHVVGATESRTRSFPVINAAPIGPPGFVSGFAFKLSPTGEQVVYSTTLGEGESAQAESVAVDAAGNAWVAGSLLLAFQFPTTDPLKADGILDAYVAKLGETGSLLFSTVFGGCLGERVGGVALLETPGNPAQPDIYVAGLTDSPDFPTRNPVQPRIGDSPSAFAPGDAFVIRISPGSGPVAPTLAPVIRFSDRQLNLAWSDNSNELSFRVERKLGDMFAAVPFTVLDTLPAGTTSYEDKNLTPNTTYTYRVIAVNAAGESPSCFQEGTTLSAPPTPPAAPSGLDATAVSSTRIDLAWNDNSGNELGFHIQRQEGNGSFAPLDTVGPGVEEYQDLTVQPGKTYTYQVRAFNGGGNSGFSNQDSATTPQDPSLPTLSINDVSVDEGDTGTTEARFTVTLSAASAQTVTVLFSTADGSGATGADAGTDYQPHTAQTLTFLPNVTTREIVVQVIGDLDPEVNEIFFVNLSAPSNAAIADGQGRGTIRNDDTAPEVDLSILKETAQGEVVLGDTVVYTLTVRNLGPDGATNVQVRDTLPAGLTFVSADPAPASIVGQSLRWDLGALADGEEVLITLRARADQEGLARNTATVSGAEEDPAAGNDRSTVDVTVLSDGGGKEGILEISPGRLRFGKVHPATCVAKWLELRNTGGGVLTVRILGVGGPFSVPRGRVTLKAGESRRIRVRFCPGLPGRYSSAIRLLTAGKDGKTFRVPVDGRCGFNTPVRK